VAWSDLDIWETFQEFYSSSSIVREAMTLASLAPDPWMCIGDRIDKLPTIQKISTLLEQHTNNFDNPLEQREFKELEDLSNHVLQGSMPEWIEL